LPDALPNSPAVETVGQRSLRDRSLRQIVAASERILEAKDSVEHVRGADSLREVAK